MENNGTDLFVIILLGFFLTLLMAAFIVVMVVIHRQRQFRNQQRLEAVQVAFEKTMAEVEKEIREETLAHVGRELHDNIGQLLSLVKMNLASSKPEKVAEGKSMVNQVIKEVRALSQSLNLDWVESLSLPDFIAQQLDKLKSAGFCETVFEMEGEMPLLSKDQKLVFIRTVQEVLNNAIKYAEPTRISAKVVVEGKGLLVMVDDDGKGFDTEGPSKGMGMTNLRKRMEAIGGSFELNSAPGMGTQARLYLPLSKD